MLIDFHLNTRARFLLKKPPTYTLTFKLYDHRVARRIWEICLKNPLPPVSRDRFYGFNDSLEDIEKSLHNCVEQIKTLRPDLNLENIDAFKGKNVQRFPHSISGTKVQFNFDEMIPGTIYFRPDQQNSMFERDPENQVIIQYNIFTGEKIKEIPIGG